MTSLRPLGTVRIDIAGGTIDIVRHANQKEPQSWLALSYSAAEKLGAGLLEAARMGRDLDNAKSSGE